MGRHLEDAEGMVSCKPFVPTAVFVCKDDMSMADMKAQAWVIVLD